MVQNGYPGREEEEKRQPGRTYVEVPLLTDQSSSSTTR
jgi:hypothetical protein